MSAGEASPEVCLLVAVTNSNSGEQQEDTALQEEATRWCVDNGFELIQWTPGERESTSHNGTASV